MSKKFKSCKCIHCLRYFDDLTSDHVFPESWYPDTTPPNLEKWQAPSCRECNETHGKNEKDLLQRIGLCLNPSEMASIGIPQKALRAINPDVGKNEKDRQHRLQRRKKTLKELIPLEKIPDESLFPGFDNREEAELMNCPGMLVPKEGLEMLSEKLVRGVTYVLDQKLIDSNHIIDIFFLRKQSAEPFLESLEKFGGEYHCGPGIKVRRAAVPDYPQCGIFEIDIWGKVRIYATVELASKTNCVPPSRR